MFTTEPETATYARHVLFKKDDGSTTATANDEVTVTHTNPTEAKGRPTPTRKEAEAARKAAAKGAPLPGANKKEQRLAAREQAAKQRQIAREGMMRGDERYLPQRDRGPVRKFVRDFVDSRRTVAEFFVPVAVVVLLAGLVGNTQLQAVVTLLWLLIIVVVATDTTFLLWRMNKQLKQQWPDKADRKGVNFYAVMRGLQVRRLRMPPAQYKAGGRPVEPK